MSNEGVAFHRLYFAAFMILLAVFTVVAITIAGHLLNLSKEVRSIRLILENDYQTVYETNAQSH